MGAAGSTNSGHDAAGPLTRRRFLRGSLTVAAGGAALVACRDDSGSPPPSGRALESDEPFHCDLATTFFNPAEARAVDALTDRILPGTPDDPGAREARVVAYIDCLLGTGDGWSRPVYRMPPFVAPADFTVAEVEAMFPDAPRLVPDDDRSGTGETGDGEDEPDDPDPDDLEATGFGIVAMPAGAYDRYGYQLFLDPPAIYRRGLAALDRYARAAAGAPLADLDPTAQDLVVGALDDDTATGFDVPSAKAFFEQVRRHTIEGMFSDPRYGGNHDLAGWRLVGWPGAQRAYTPIELRTERAPREPQSLAQLHRFNPGHDDTGHADLPVATRPGASSR